MIIYTRQAPRLIEDEPSFDPDQPRASDGRFGKKAGSKKGAETSTDKIDAKRLKIKTASLKRAASRDELPEHIKALKLPPAWTDIRYADDPKADIQAVGKDAKGRPQYVYHKDFVSAQAAAKFERINALDDKIEDISSQVDADLKKGSEDAACLKMIMATGVRPGSDKDTGAAKKAYGATTLEGRHVVVDGKDITLRFTGKKGVSLDIPVTDPAVKRDLIKRKAAAGDDGRLFGTDSKKLSGYTHALDGGGFKTKDMRTHLGTSLAVDLVKGMPAPTNEREYRTAVRAVAQTVSRRLGNTPTVALQSYIAPACFTGWRQQIGA